MSSLANKVIVNTRPIAQSQELSQLLSHQGATVIECPLLAIELLAWDSDPLTRNKIINIDRYDQVIVVSAHAADVLVDALDRYWPQLPVGISFWAVGQKTAKHLQNLSLSVKLPAVGYDSESLLQESQLSDVEHQSILLVRGIGGRHLLYETLEKRGATVDYLELYRRVWPQSATAMIKQHHQHIDALLMTSVDMLLHYHDIIQQNMSELYRLYDCPLVVASERIKQQAVSIGFRCVENAEGADSAHLLSALQQLFTLESDTHG